MENSFYKEVWILIKKNLNQYKEWLKPVPGDPVGLTAIKSLFKGLSTLFLIAFSPVVAVILFISFLAAF